MTTAQAEHARAAAELSQEAAWYLTQVIDQLKQAGSPLAAAHVLKLQQELAIIYAHVQLALQKGKHPTAGPMADIDPPTRPFDILEPSKN